MIGNAIKKLLLENEENFLIKDEDVAHLLDTHPLNHALLVLSKAGYSRIPVVNKEDQLVGLIGLRDIVDAMFDVADIDPSNLNGLQVKDQMETEFQTLQIPYEIEDILHLLVDDPFIPIVDKDRHFEGIITRRKILKAVNHMAHEFELEYIVTEKEESSSPKERKAV